MVSGVTITNMRQGLDCSCKYWPLTACLVTSYSSQCSSIIVFIYLFPGCRQNWSFSRCWSASSWDVTLPSREMIQGLLTDTEITVEPNWIPTQVHLRDWGVQPSWFDSGAWSGSWILSSWLDIKSCYCKTIWKINRYNFRFVFDICTIFTIHNMQLV